MPDDFEDISKTCSLLGRSSELVTRLPNATLHLVLYGLPQMSYCKPESFPS